MEKNQGYPDYNQEKRGPYPPEHQPLVGNPPPYNEQGPSPNDPAQQQWQQQQQWQHQQQQPWPGQGQQQQVPNVVYQQPNIVYVQPQRLENPPKDYLVQNIFATICCCWCIGVLAIMNSVKCREAISAGNRPNAELTSRKARKYMCWTIWVGVVIVVLSIGLQILRVVLELNYSH